MQIVSLEDTLHEVSNPISRKNQKNISKCHLLIFLPIMQTVKTINVHSSRLVFFYFNIKIHLYAVSSHYKHLKEELVTTTLSSCCFFFFVANIKNIRNFCWKKEFDLELCMQYIKISQLAHLKQHY